MPTVQLSPVASTILVATYVIGTLILVVFVGAIGVVLLKLNATLEAYQAKLDPLLDQTQSVLVLANTKLTSIGDKTEAILSQGEVTAEVVHEKVEKTATMVQHTVNAPLIGLNALSSGLISAVRTFGKLQRAPVILREATASLDAPIFESLSPVIAGTETVDLNAASTGVRVRRGI